MKTIICIPARKRANEIPADVEVDILNKGPKTWIIYDTKRAGLFVNRYLINWVDTNRLHEYCKTSKAPTMSSESLEAIFLFKYYNN